ncbi:hypothetical protein CSIV_05075 [Microbacterium sp. CSI-V]|uniref:hypothetical protein n=1 Tax=Microbacterium sp. CSI-V TaxID=1933777 RepID=UPI00097BEF21|nr:hypothetical protein [Microbacterium sp. CSI-V]ONI65652.1 hypothetical protein CSIV_05075 [Microbacterium sp. CSI-V]
MILQESKTVPIAEADWTDDGEVELLTFPTPDGHCTHMLPETARALAQQLIQAAADAEKAAGESGVQRAHRTAQHAFDIDQRVDALGRQVEESISNVLSHNWRWSEQIGDPVCSRCGTRATSNAVRVSACPGPLEAPGVRS